MVDWVMLAWILVLSFTESKIIRLAIRRTTSTMTRFILSGFEIKVNWRFSEIPQEIFENLK